MKQMVHSTDIHDAWGVENQLNWAFRWWLCLIMYVMAGSHVCGLCVCEFTQSTKSHLLLSSKSWPVCLIHSLLNGLCNKDSMLKPSRNAALFKPANLDPHSSQWSRPAGVWPMWLLMAVLAWKVSHLAPLSVSSISGWRTKWKLYYLPPMITDNLLLGACTSWNCVFTTP